MTLMFPGFREGYNPGVYSVQPPEIVQPWTPLAMGELVPVVVGAVGAGTLASGSSIGDDFET
jgi:hypothetical protein